MDNDSFTSSFIVNSNGYKLYCRYWKPKATPRAIVFIAHGFGEHSYYYQSLASALIDKQYFVFAHDHVGHGRSEGPKALIDNLDKYVDDVFQHIDLIREKYPEIPIFYIGNSMGGTIGAKAALKSHVYFKGMVFIGAGILICQNLIYPSLIKLSQFVGWMFPRLPIAKVDYSFGTRNQDVVEERRNDPLSLQGYVKAGIIKAMLTAMEDIQQNVQAIQCPLLVMHGEDDKISHVEGSRILYEKCSSTDKTLRTYPKAYHGLLHEPEGIKEQVIENITNWIEERIE